MEQEIFTIVDAISKLGFTGLLVVLAVPKLRKTIFGNGNGVTKLTENHFPHLENKMDKIIELIGEQNEKNAERHGEIMGKLK